MQLTRCNVDFYINSNYSDGLIIVYVIIGMKTLRTSTEKVFWRMISGTAFKARKFDISWYIAKDVALAYQQL